MTLSNADRKLIEEVATIWVDSGGDADGIDWVLNDLKKRITEIRQERKSGDEHNER